MALLTVACTSAGARPHHRPLPEPTANPSPDPVCTFAHPTKTVDSLKRLPGPIRRALLKSAGAMADRGEFFNAGDVVMKPAPFNRFIRGGEIGEKWFAWYEHGGFAYWTQIVIFGSDPSGTPHILANERSTDGNLCAATDALLDKATH